MSSTRCFAARRRSPALRSRQDRTRRCRECRGSVSDSAARRSVNLWVSAIDSAAGVITLSAAVDSSALGALAPRSGAALRPGRGRSAGRSVDDAVGAPRPDAPAHLAHGARGAHRVGEPGRRPRARCLGSGSQRGIILQPNEKAPFGVLQHVVAHHRSLFAQPPSSVRTRVRIGAPPPPRPRPVTIRTAAPGGPCACARRNRSALATASQHRLTVEVEGPPPALGRSSRACASLTKYVICTSSLQSAAPPWLRPCTPNTLRFGARFGIVPIAQANCALLGSCPRRRVAPGLPAETRGPVRIGVAGSFSDPIGLPMQLAAELAAEEINAAGGHRRAAARAGDPRRLRRSRLRRLRRGRSLRLGRVGSGRPSLLRHHARRRAGLQRRRRSGGRHLSPSSSSPEVSSAGDYTFRVCPSDLAHGAALAALGTRALHLERGAVLYLNDQYGRGIRQTFVPRLHAPRRRARGGRSLSRRPAGCRTLPRPPGAEPEHPSSSWWPATAARPRKSFARRRSAGITDAGARRRRARGHRGGRCAGRRRLSHLALLPVHSHRRQPAVRRGLPPQISRTPACRTSPRRRPTTPSICCSDVIARAGTEPRRRSAARWPAWAR